VTRVISGAEVPDSGTAGGDAGEPLDAGVVAVDAGAIADGGPDPVVDAGRQPVDAGPVPDPSRRGPYTVGVRTVKLTDPSRSRMLEVEVWYPAQSDGKSNTYELNGALGSIATLSSSARRDATPVAGGPWPLVVFSHGFGGIRFQSYFFTEQLASHGFVVAAPDHTGNTLLDLAQLGSDTARAQSAIDRPLDVIFLTDELLAGVSALGALPLDATRIGLSGHSFGGWTTLEAARRDPRFKVLIPMAPGFRDGSTPGFVAMLNRPLLIVGGSLDHTCEFGPNQQVPYDLALRPKALLQVVNAGHLDFSNLCEIPIAPLFANDGCDATKISAADVHSRVRTVSTAFALKYLAGAPGQESWLDPATVKAMGKVDYWSAP
jgi:predicted dienelactone hydrolase